MYKVLVFLKRKPGMSVQDFRDYYENVHSKLGIKYRGKCRKYSRRYIEPFTDPLTGAAPDFSFDVITELWYDSAEDFQETFRIVNAREIAEEIFADEEICSIAPSMPMPLSWSARMSFSVMRLWCGIAPEVHRQAGRRI